MDLQSKEYLRGFRDGYDQANISEFINNQADKDDTQSIKADYQAGFVRGLERWYEDLQERQYIDRLDDYESNNGIPSTVE